MDGVLVDFDGGVNRFFGKNPQYGPKRDWEFDYQGDFNMTPQQFWKCLGHDFWSTLGFTKEGMGVLEMLYSRGLEKQVCLLSSPTLEPGCWSGKAQWVKDNLPHFYHGKQFILSYDKLWNVQPDALLIDDRYETCSKWVAAGGQAFVFPRPWNPLYEEEPKALQWLEEHLDYLGAGRKDSL